MAIDIVMILKKMRVACGVPDGADGGEEPHSPQYFRSWRWCSA
jgi:hypothetical protein